MNKLEFQQKISESNKPVIIDFWATWCGPCMMTKPILDKLGKEYAEKVEFMPINADDSREVLEQFRVFGIPTVITLRNGKEVGRVTGAQNETNYRMMFEALAEGREVKVPLTQFDRMLRLGGGALFVMVGISTHNWVVAGIGGVIAFMGIYDRCPIWRAVTGMFKRS
ncbi:MAG: thioredoxin [Anaerolineales bacterium]|nr:thioredoxin [Anaerolineales bacterium]